MLWAYERQENNKICYGQTCTGTTVQHSSFAPSPGGSDKQKPVHVHPFREEVQTPPKRKDYSWPAGLRVGSQGTSCRRKQTGRDLVWQVLPVRAELSCWAQRTAQKLNKQQTWQTHARQNAKFCSDSDTASKSEAGNNDLRHTGLTSQGLVNRARL